MTHHTHEAEATTDHEQREEEQEEEGNEGDKPIPQHAYVRAPSSLRRTDGPDAYGTATCFF